MKVLVAGGGIGGLAAALALARRGARVVVLERAETFGEAGAGLQLSPNATRILFDLGLEPPLRRLAFAPQAAEVRDVADGGLLLRTPLGEAAVRRWGAPYLQAHRADLHAALLAAAEAAGVALYTASPIDGFAETADGVELEAAGRRLSGEVLIGADGIRSRIRAVLQGETPARYTGHVAWRGLAEASRLPPGLIPPTATVWTAPGAHFVHYYVRGGELVNFVGFTRQAQAPAESWSQDAAPGEMAAAFAGWPAPVQALIAAQAQAGRQGWRSAIHDRPPDRRWSRGRVALLGDAAHPMPPYLAQGAGMAIEDAEALARRLSEGSDPAAALAAYAAERFPRTARVQAWARRNGAIFHLPRLLRQAAFAIARRGAPGARLDWLYGEGDRAIE